MKFRPKLFRKKKNGKKNRIARMSSPLPDVPESTVLDDEANSIIDNNLHRQRLQNSNITRIPPTVVENRNMPIRVEQKIYLAQLKNISQEHVDEAPRPAWTRNQIPTNKHTLRMQQKILSSDITTGSEVTGDTISTLSNNINYDKEVPPPKRATLGLLAEMACGASLCSLTKEAPPDAEISEFPTLGVSGQSLEDIDNRRFDTTDGNDNINDRRRYLHNQASMSRMNDYQGDRTLESRYETRSFDESMGAFSPARILACTNGNERYYEPTLEPGLNDASSLLESNVGDEATHGNNGDGEEDIVTEADGAADEKSPSLAQRIAPSCFSPCNNADNTGGTTIASKATNGANYSIADDSKAGGESKHTYNTSSKKSKSAKSRSTVANRLKQAQALVESSKEKNGDVTQTSRSRSNSLRSRPSTAKLMNDTETAQQQPEITRFVVEGEDDALTSRVSRVRAESSERNSSVADSKRSKSLLSRISSNLIGASQSSMKLSESVSTSADKLKNGTNRTLSAKTDSPTDSIKKTEGSAGSKSTKDSSNPASSVDSEPDNSSRITATKEQGTAKSGSTRMVGSAKAFLSSLSLRTKDLVPEDTSTASARLMYDKLNEKNQKKQKTKKAADKVMQAFFSTGILNRRKEPEPEVSRGSPSGMSLVTRDLIGSEAPMLKELEMLREAAYTAGEEKDGLGDRGLESESPVYTKPTVVPDPILSSEEICLRVRNLLDGPCIANTAANNESVASRPFPGTESHKQVGSWTSPGPLDIVGDDYNGEEKKTEVEPESTLLTDISLKTRDLLGPQEAPPSSCGDLSLVPSISDHSHTRRLAGISLSTNDLVGGTDASASLVPESTQQQHQIGDIGSSPTKGQRYVAGMSLTSTDLLGSTGADNSLLAEPSVQGVMSEAASGTQRLIDRDILNFAMGNITTYTPKYTKKLAGLSVDTKELLGPENTVTTSTPATMNRVTRHKFNDVSLATKDLLTDPQADGHVTATPPTMNRATRHKFNDLSLATGDLLSDPHADLPITKATTGGEEDTGILISALTDQQREFMGLRPKRSKKVRSRAFIFSPQESSAFHDALPRIMNPGDVDYLDDASTLSTKLSLFAHERAGIVQGNPDTTTTL